MVVPAQIQRRPGAAGDVQHVGAGHVLAYVRAHGEAEEVPGKACEDLGAEFVGSFLLCGGGSDGDVAWDGCEGCEE